MINRDNTGGAAARALFWRLAINRKLHATALAEERYEDANYYAKCIGADARRAARVLEESQSTEEELE